MSTTPGHRRPCRCTRQSTVDETARGRRGFTLVEIMVAMAVSAFILSAVVSLAWALSTYNNEGEAAIELATYGRHAMLSICRDIRAARAAGVSQKGALVLWMGDLDDDGRMTTDEFVLYYQPAGSTEVRRLSFAAKAVVGNVGTTAFQTIINLYDYNNLAGVAESWGLQPTDAVVCERAESVGFYPNRAVPQTLTVEVLLDLSRPENLIEGTGETIVLNLYDTGTMRVPYEDDGFDPQF